MEQNYEIVPNIISCKDLDYLSDMFNWNYGAYKSSLNASQNVEDQEIKDLLSNCSNMFYIEMQNVLDIMSKGGGSDE